MIDLNSEYPDKESFEEEFNRIFARMRDCMADMTLLFKKMKDNCVYFSKEEAAEFMRCTVDTIPLQLKKYQCGRIWIYKKSDIIEFLDEHSTKRKR